MSPQQTAFIGKLDPASLADEQLRTDFFFQSCNGSAQRGLGDMEPFGAFRHMLGFRNIKEICYLLEVHSINDNK